MQEEGASKLGTLVKELPIWKKLLFSFSSVLLVSGVGLKGLSFVSGGGESADRAPGTELVHPNATNLSRSPDEASDAPTLEPAPLIGEAPRWPPGPTRDPAPAAEEQSALDEWSPALVVGGLSFFVGFSLGYVLRTFLKIAAVISGLVFLAIFALAYFDILHMDWDALSGHFETFAMKIKEEAGEFRTFITGSLPSAGMTGLGLFTGFKRK